MRILMTAPTYYQKGGTETIVRNLTIKLNESGIRTDVMTFNMDQKWHPKWRGDVEKTDGFAVFKIPGLNWHPWAESFKITMGVNLIPGMFLDLLKDYDIIHYHEELSFPFFSYFVKRPKIFHFHGWIDVSFHRRYFLHTLILKHIADFYICLTETMARNLSELGVTEDKIRILPNGVDTDIFCPSGKKEDNLVLFIGRVSFNKGIHILLKALSYVEKPVHLAIIGSSDWNQTFFQKTLNLIDYENRKGIHRVTYLGSQKHSSVVEWCQKASIFVLPSFWEGSPVVNLEALSCETPVVATSIGGIPEVVRDGETGILVPPNSAAKLAEALNYLLDNEKIRTKLGKQGRRFVKKHFSLDVMVEKLCQIYGEVLNNR